MRYDNLQIPTAIRPDAKLGKLTTSIIGKFFAYNEGLDGFDVVEIKPMQLTATDADYLGGNELKTTLIVPPSLSEVKAVLAPVFPNLSTVVMGDTEEVVLGLGTALAGLSCTVVVPNSLLAAYQAEYPSLTFDSWVYQVEFDIPASGDSELTYEWVDTVVSGASGDIGDVDKVVVDSSFVTFEVGVFDYIFLKFVNASEIQYGVVKVPSGYQEVEYIESTGTQWIDTGVYPTSETKAILSISDFVYANNSYFFRGGVQEVSMFGVYVYSSGNTIFPVFGVNSYSINSTVLKNSDRHTIELSKDGLVIDENTIRTFPQGTFEATTATIKLLASQGGDNPATYFTSCKVYSFTLAIGGTLTRDFVPCYRIADGVIGLYDRVNDVFYTNDGTGTFAKGSDVVHKVERPALSTCTIYYDSDTPHTLTPEIVQATLTKVPEFASCEKVIVPVWFTEYESGAINAIIQAFPSLRTLTTCYAAGDFDLDLTGELYSRIVAMNKNIDDVLVNTKQFEQSHLTATSYKNMDLSGLVIFPPLGGTHVTTIGYNLNCDDLIYFPLLDLRGVTSASAQIGYFPKNYFYGARIKAGPNTNLSGFASPFYSTSRGNVTVQELTLDGLEKSMNLWYDHYLNVSRTNYTREALVQAFNSLGTPATTQTLTIGATNLAKLTAEDIAIATNKGWTLA